jgi:hypothetical protein
VGRSINMLVELPPEEVRARLSREIDQSPVSRFLGLSVVSPRYVGWVGDSSFSFRQTWSLVRTWESPGPVCEGDYGPCASGTHVVAGIRRSWAASVMLGISALVMLIIVCTMVAQAAGGDAGWWAYGFGFALYLLVIFMVRAQMVEDEDDMKAFLMGLFAARIVRQSDAKR